MGSPAFIIRPWTAIFSITVPSAGARKVSVRRACFDRASSAMASAGTSNRRNRAVAERVRGPPASPSDWSATR